MAPKGQELADFIGLNQRMKIQLSKLWVYFVLGLFFFFIASQIVGFSYDLSEITNSFSELVRSFKKKN